MSKAVLNTIGRTFTLAAILASLSLSISANERHDPSNGTFPKLDLPQTAHGEEAIDSLGAQLPAVAQSYGHLPDELRNLFRSDPRLHVDRTGRLFYMDEGVPQNGIDPTLQSPVVAASAPYPLANTFLLHSRPGATRVIFMDFGGYVLTGTAWNSTYSTINAPPWDIDGNPSSFGDGERTIIQGIWQRVSEDYAPFDVDVTTEYPGEAAMTRTDLNDGSFGIRVLISPISSYFGSYGGISYVGIFDHTSDYYKPSLVFPENLANDEKNMAEAISHEAGHTLGLSHDGTTTGSAYYAGSGSGATGWAPIMGVGYYQSLTQWSKGEYANANNQEDDLVVIQSNGLSYRPDDHGNTSATATHLPAGSALSASGVIERNTDVDVFAFVTGAGAISINVDPAVNGPNLDLLVQLYNSSGTLLGVSNPTGALNASLNLTVPAGTYYLWVQGTGQGDPLTGYSNYASLGSYTITGTVVGVAGNVPPLAVVSATPVSGSAPLTVQFSSGQSSDPDGTISAYLWTFGDGGTSTSPTVSHTYSNAGTYTASLKVTDNGGLSATSTVGIVVNAPTSNVLPTAIASATPLSGSAPLLVSFTGSSSYDPDGSIVLYHWNFGDGASADGANLQHTYQSAGTYSAVLTVTDNQGGSNSRSVSVSVLAPASTLMHVSAIALVSQFWSAWGNVTATVTLVDSNGRAVPGATVAGNWSGAVNGATTATTSSSGQATFTSSNVKRGSTVTFSISNVTKSGYTYDAAHSTTSHSISAAATL